MVQVIAEIGCNHKGDIGIAKKLVSIASSYCGAHVAKFQKRNNCELLSKEQYNAPHPVPENSYGATYGLHRETLEFTQEQHVELKAHCEKEGIVYSTSVWDLTSAKEIAALNPVMIKIPSACNTHFLMQEYLCENFFGEIHISTGMTSQEEIEKIVSFYEARNRVKDLVLYACTSGYPVDFEDICLLEITRLKERFAHRVKQFGFSGHHLGIAVDIAAVTLGAAWVERHFTLDRTWKGTDHAASLEPDGLRRLCRDIANTEKALSYKREEILPVEAVQRDKLKWRAANA
ncbi:N-acetylneuraminate synthase [Deltaproteobacteria bacterium]|nr:N-acetylneuraminate synthase [Deltaproteobacteria bacterium]